jgi:hypothetical protein
MRTSFELLKNGNNATAVWANPTTREIYPANRNSFGWNALFGGDNSAFYQKYGKNMKLNSAKSRYGAPSWSYRQMNEIGFVLVMRGDKPLW